MRYKIQKGDTLSGIAKKFGTSWNQLARDNKIMNPDKIKSGSSIIVPQAQKPTMETQVETVTRTRSPLSAMIGDKVISRTTPKIQRSQEDLQRTPIMNPRTKTIKSKTTAVPVKSKGLMARSQKKADESQSLLSQTPTKVFLTSLVSSPVLGKDFFKDKEYEALKEIGRDQIRKGETGATYSTYNKAAGKKVGYKMELPDLNDPREALKFTLGKTDFVRDGDRIIAADEFDLEGKEKISKKSMVDKIKFLANRTGQYLSGDMSLYGFGHSVGEVLSPPGQGPSFRIDLGTAKELGVSNSQFKNLPTLDEYKSKYKDRIKQRPIRDLFKSLGII